MLRKHARLRKLGGTEARPAVINGAALRLLAPTVDPVKLLPKPLQEKMQRPGIGNLFRSPLDAPRWVAFVKTYRTLIELGSFWSVSGEERDALIDRAIDAERKAYCKQTAASDGCASLDPATAEELARYSEAGQAFATEPSRQIEAQTQLEAEAAALEYRAQLEAEENAKLQQAVAAYGRTLRRQQRRALKLLCTDLSLTGAKIAVRCRVSEATVSKIRANVEELADKILTIPPEESSATVEAPPAEVPQDESVTQIADALEAGALDLAAVLQAPDADVSESVLHGYARSKNSGAFMRDNWSGGRRRFNDAEPVTGGRYGGRWDDPAKIVLRDSLTQHASKFSDIQMRELREKAAAAEVALGSLMQTIDAFLSKRAAESVDDLMAASISPKRRA
jgi:hypothetical protein